jgi:hypothetical protein
MDKNNPITILDEINKDEFHKNLKKILEVLDAYEQKIELTEIHALEIKEYLRLLDLIFEVEIRTIPSLNNTKKNIIISQPGIRYSQAIALINSLLLDEKFFELSLKDKDYIISRITSEIKGRMMEDIILLETKIFNPEKEDFKLQFAIGEFDMVVFDPFTSSCEIYEIKHSREAHYNQYQYLIDNEKLKQTKLKYGDITRKCVIYNGESHIENDIEYINVEKYLMFN